MDCDVCRHATTRCRCSLSAIVVHRNSARDGAAHNSPQTSKSHIAISKVALRCSNATLDHPRRSSVSRSRACERERDSARDAYVSLPVHRPTEWKRDTK
ncbi:hypothetical protein EVAR_7983_1 [Eumeta japonica]|uniref:Uncharacterized protein n=1 Tax=Eumeta variegata TaxID=151549 RepID=A0A4C1TJI7_EUMVA|nr:hypothetical protein EVAR_7983_1 [Eumeta japonica]